ncbi:MAG: multicopper oxidase domain-containing protein [Anaerolineales bacterium]|nr:multicopper oxidase domain-containing protein [Anaerolineales bacterium]
MQPALKPAPPPTSVRNIADAPVTVGNPLIARSTPSDYPTPIDQLAPVLVIVPSAVLPAGNLQNFQVFNQPAADPGIRPSAGGLFHAFVLRPTGNPNEYLVVYDSGLLTMPALPEGSAGQIETFAVNPPVAVEAGDVIAHYGSGIPVDIVTTGTDQLVYPAPTAPTGGGVILAGVDPYPIYPQAHLLAAATVNIAGAAGFNGGIRKFVDSMPGLTAANANNLGQFMPIAIPDTTTFPGADYYEIELGQYTEQLHSDLPPTTLRGYRQTNTTDPTVNKFSYLGPMIVASRDRPVRVKFTNNLPIDAAGDLFLPVDTTVMGAGEGPIEIPGSTPGTTVRDVYKENRATVHLHGGLVPWISDGTPHQWTTPAGETTSYPRGVSVSNVPDMWYDATGAVVPPETLGAAPDPGQGALTFYYNNQQSARLMFYHDHAYGITRLNVYAGEAAGYLITDQVEQDLINGTNESGVNPGLVMALPDIGIPLIIQDKTFVDATTIGAQDPNWKWGTGDFDTETHYRVPKTGDLWLPNVYMPAQNPWDLSGASAFGRWQYGPWFWPPTEDIINGPVVNEYYDPACDSAVIWCEPPMRPAMPDPSMGMEAYMDTMMVNGTLYPYLDLEPKTYRFRILNAANDRFVNLQMYVADPDVTTVDGRTNTEVKMVAATRTTGFPPKWPIDGREGGVPDPKTAGPSWIQVGTEGGFLPAPVVIPNQPVTWNANATAFNVGNVLDHSLLVGSAERADVLVDFAKFAGKTVILYNDAPAAFPALDPRYDYYTGNPDQTDTGGTPTTQAGYAPNTRTIMQFRIAASAPAAAYDLNTLKAVFAKTPGKRGVFEVSQDPIIIPQATYNSAYDASLPGDAATAYVRITDRAKTFTPLGASTPVTITFEEKAIHDEMGAAYDNEWGRMSGFLGLELPGTNNLNQNIILYGYASPPVDVMEDSITPIGTLGDGTQIWKITHNGVDTHPIHFHLMNVQLINRVAWDGALIPPDPNELGWKETVRVNPLESTIVAMRPVAPTQPFDIPNSVRPLDPTKPLGEVLMGPPGGFKDPELTGVTVVNHMVNFGWEYVWHCHILSHEEMDMMHPIAFAVAPNRPTGLTVTYNGGGADLTWADNSLNETGFTIQRAADPNFTTDLVTFEASPGATSFTDPTIGNALVLYYRVFASNLVGDSVSYLAPSIGFPTAAMPSDFSETVTLARLPGDPTGLVATAISGSRIDLVWNDVALEQSYRIERALVTDGIPGAFSALVGVAADVTTFSDVTVSPNTTYAYQVVAVNTNGDSAPSNIATATTPIPIPATPANLTASALSPFQVDLAWVDLATDEDGFRVERALVTGGVPEAFTVLATLGLDVAAYSDTAVTPGMSYAYRVVAFNGFGDSMPSNVATATTPVPVPATPGGLIATVQSATQVNLAWTDNATDETGYRVERAVVTGGVPGAFTVVATLGANAAAYNDTTATPSTVLAYQVIAFNNYADSLPSNVAIVTTPAPQPVPAAPTNLVATLQAGPRVSLTWRDNAINETGFVLERQTNGGGFTQVALIGPRNNRGNVNYVDLAVALGNVYDYRVTAVNSGGPSAPSNVVTVNVAPPAAPSNFQVTAVANVNNATVTLTWTDNANNESGFTVQRATNAAFTQGLNTIFGSMPVIKSVQTRLDDWSLSLLS